MAIRTAVKVLGVVIGTATGWDTVDDIHFVFYDFEPADHVTLPKGDLNVDYLNGLFQQYDDDGKAIIWATSIISVLK